MKYMALEISTKSIESVVLGERGDIIHRSTFGISLEKIRDVIEKVKPPIVLTFEEGELAGWLYRNLVYDVDQLVVADPWHNRLIYDSDDKDDQVDVMRLANLLRGSFIHPVHHTEDQDRADFKSLVYSYHNLSKQLTRCQNQLKSVYRQQGIIVKNKAIYSQKHREEYLSRLYNPVVAKSYYDMIDMFSLQKDEMEKRIRRESKKYPEISRFEEIPGVGIIIASTYYAVIDDPNRFHKKQKLWSYAHLGMGRHNTAERKRNKRQKRGNRLLKYVTLQAVAGAIRSKPNPYKNQYIDLVCVKGKGTRLARRIVGRSILTTVWIMWKRGERYKEQVRKIKDNWKE